MAIDINYLKSLQQEASDLESKIAAQIASTNNETWGKINECASTINKKYDDLLDSITTSFYIDIMSEKYNDIRLVLCNTEKERCAYIEGFRSRRIMLCSRYSGGRYGYDNNPVDKYVYYKLSPDIKMDYKYDLVKFMITNEELIDGKIVKAIQEHVAKRMQEASNKAANRSAMIEITNEYVKKNI